MGILAAVALAHYVHPGLPCRSQVLPQAAVPRVAAMQSSELQHCAAYLPHHIGTARIWGSTLRGCCHHPPQTPTENLDSVMQVVSYAMPL
jgi:hypothetical protein